MQLAPSLIACAPDQFPARALVMPVALAMITDASQRLCPNLRQP
jgi:hypothetical protein